jgi:tripartite-type tricarboxylate transporter receptor subunit TctC
VVVDNTPGAGGNVGTGMVAKSPADGYTLLMSYVGTQAINGSVYRSLPFDPYQDFATLATVATVPFALVVNQQFPADNMQELVAYAKAHPGQVHFGSAGNGSLNQLLGEMAPAGTPEAVVKKINADVNEVLHDKGLLERFAASGADPYSTTPQQFAQVLREDIRKWAVVVKTSGARID